MVRDAAQEQMHIRIREAELERIDQAAELAGVSRSAFVLAAALEKADAMIVERTSYVWPEAAVAAFRAVLNEPPAPGPRALEAMARAKPWSAA